MKKIIGIATTIIILIIIIFLIKNNYKKIKYGNNIINKSIEELEEYILNIDKYNAQANIIVNSNKNQNTYIVEQEYDKNLNLYKQKVLEPENISGMEFIYEGNNLSIKNSRMTLTKIYNEYAYMGSNELSLAKFIEDYKNNENKKIYEENEEIIMEVEVKQNNIYIRNKKLYFNKKSGSIDKIEIKDKTQKTTIYILYNKVELNVAKE